MAKPLFVALILVSTVITSRVVPRTYSSYLEVLSLSTSMASEGGGEGVREAMEMSSSSCSSSDLGRWGSGGRERGQYGQ